MKRKFERFVVEDMLVTDAGSEGMAVGHHDEKVVFLRNAVPGDVVDVLITRQKKNFCEGRLLKVKKFSDMRVDPVCKHFGVCGGCKWQNMKYEHQLHFKQKIVEDNLKRIGKLEIEEWQDILACPDIFHYRNKMEYSFSNVRYLTEEDMKVPAEEHNMNALGFHVSPSFFRVLDLEHCYLPPDLSDRIRASVREYALSSGLAYYDMRDHTGYFRNMFVRSTGLGQWMVIMVFASDEPETRKGFMEHLALNFPELDSLMYVINTKKNDIISDLPVHLYKGQSYIMEELEGVKFKIGPVSFFQTNSHQVLELYRLVREFAGIQNDDVVYDLYTGTGTIANFIARCAARVVGIEYVKSAVEDAVENSAINGITNTEFYDGDLAKVLDAAFVEKNGKPSVIITDPPRAGMHPKVVEQILAIRPRRIVYVSCNSATQARDVALMKEFYAVKKVRPVDMFPHTQHVESVMLLEVKE
jgi:23S rRNA (uracil1939-C5)-methyltransferase